MCSKLKDWKDNIVEPVTKEEKTPNGEEKPEDEEPPPPPPPGGRTKKITDKGSDGEKGILIPQVTWVSKGEENWDRFNFNEHTGWP